MLRQQAKNIVGEREAGTYGARPARAKRSITLSTRTMTRTVTTDTAEAVTAPALPSNDRAGDGYDWMDTLEGTEWSVLPNWGSDGWDAGAWPHIIFVVARPRDWNGELFSYGTCVEGDTSVHWFRSRTPASKRSPPRCSSTGPPASPTDPRPSLPPPPNCRASTGNPTPAGRTRNTPGCPGRHRPGHRDTRQHPLTTSLRFPRTNGELDELFAKYLQSYEEAWTAFPDAITTVRDVRAMGLPIAVVTNGNYNQQSLKISRIGLEGLLDGIFSSELMNHAKPEPEAFTAPVKAWMYRPPRPFTSGITTVLTLKEQGTRDSRHSILIAKVPSGREQFKASRNYRRYLQEAGCLRGPAARKPIPLRDR